MLVSLRCSLPFHHAGCTEVLSTVREKYLEMEEALKQAEKSYKETLQTHASNVSASIRASCEEMDLACKTVTSEINTVETRLAMTETGLDAYRATRDRRVCVLVARAV